VFKDEGADKMLYDIGTVCVKIAGRDAGKTCVVVDILDDTYVLIDGQTRRKKCNVLHLEPLKKSLPIKKGADSATVSKSFEELGIIVKPTTAKKPASRPMRVRKNQAAETVKKATKKDTK
jgi:large subunit ribosomal protein L14e